MRSRVLLFCDYPPAPLKGWRHVAKQDTTSPLQRLCVEPDTIRQKWSYNHTAYSSHNHVREVHNEAMDKVGQKSPKISQNINSQTQTTMARVKLNPLFDSISGKMGDVIFKTHTGSDGLPKTTMHRYGHFDTKKRRWVNSYERSTPLSNRERKARSKFGIIAREVARRQAEGDQRSRKVIWAEVKEVCENVVG